MWIKRWSIIFVLIVSICGTLCGCGKSDAVKNVESLISDLGEVTVDSEEEIKNVEAQYEALSDKEKEQVENINELTAKREELNKKLEEAEQAKLAEEEAKRIEEENRRKELIEKGKPFFGNWKNIYRDIIEEDLVYNKYGSFGGEDWEQYEATTRSIELLNDITINEENLLKVEDASITVKGASYDIIEEQGITLLTSSGGNTFVKAEDYDRLFDSIFVRVRLDENNINDYIGAPEYVGRVLDEWDDEYADLLVLSSKVFDDGLIMLTYKDVQYEFIYSGGEFTLYEPYTTVIAQGDYRFRDYGRAQGEIIFVNSDFVKNISIGPKIIYDGYSMQARKIEFKDGFVFDFFVNDWPKSTATFDIRY